MSETAAAGATPVVGGATPPQTPPAQPAAGQPATPPSPPATSDDYPEGLGDAGKRAIDRMKDEREAALARAKAAERERDELKASTQTESERALADAKKAGDREATEKWTARIRRAEVRTALVAAGINASVLDLAAKADQFASLKVSDDGDVEGLSAAVESLKRATPDLFVKPQPSPKPTDAGLGPRGTAASGFDMNDAIRKAAGRA